MFRSTQLLASDGNYKRIMRLTAPTGMMADRLFVRPSLSDISRFLQLAIVHTQPYRCGNGRIAQWRNTIRCQLQGERFLCIHTFSYVAKASRPGCMILFLGRGVVRPARTNIEAMNVDHIKVSVEHFNTVAHILRDVGMTLAYEIEPFILTGQFPGNINRMFLTVI